MNSVPMSRDLHGPSLCSCLIYFHVCYLTMLSVTRAYSVDGSVINECSELAK
jgi:hypothetical protein